jgi:deoxyribodipyrimidine photo-lyase
MVPASRIRVMNARGVNPGGAFVLYWMTMARRVGSNFGLQRAVEQAVALKKPLVVLEAVRCDYPDASDRLHQFLLDGMADNARAFARTRALYYPYVEPARGHGRGLVTGLSRLAAAIVTDLYPAYFLPRMLHAASRQTEVVVEAIDSNGLIPLSAGGRYFPVARSFRAFVQRELPGYLRDLPDENPLAGVRGLPRLTELPLEIRQRWPPAAASILQGGPSLAALPIDHSVPATGTRGGHTAAQKRLADFVERQLGSYAEARNHPDADGTSRLSPYLHFGHVSAHEVFGAVMTAERWTMRRLSRTRGGAREGWWGVSPPAEAFLDQLVVWRELAFNTCEYLPRFDRASTLPEWAQRTLEQHRHDPRPHRYRLDALARARTHDPIWNAAQRQLLAEGWFHGYLRMLWGKKILEWSPSAGAALERMRTIMNRYALDGRDPNSYAGYAWVLGRYDRPWPERPIFGTLRYMSSESTRRKLKLKQFLATYGQDA